ncbi:unnamed protein product [Closterium sp. NIES-53]
MLALCQEHRLEHRTKHIALRYFLARELQQRGQLRLAYVASQANTADVFTKALQPCDHQPCFAFLDWSCDLLFSPTLPMGLDDKEEDDGYLSDDPEERYDVQGKSKVAHRISLAIVLLIPIAFKLEATRVQATLRALFNQWKKDLNMEIQATMDFQELTALFQNKKQYSRLQVTFTRAQDANFVWKHGIVHTV